MAMSYRTIAVASCLFAVGCGSAPPPAADMPHPAPEATAASASPDLEKAQDKGVMTAAAPPPPALQGASPPGGAGGDGGDKNSRSGVNQAVVAPPEPLSGKPTQADIARILEGNGDVFGECYTLGAGGKTKDFKGIVTVKATIGPSGVVNQVDVTKSTAKNPKVDACVREAFKKIRFPHPRDGATSVITFPISFNGVEQVN
jgi:TonB family protein